jgi:drug/metabolite transporter (DMT)-like permease
MSLSTSETQKGLYYGVLSALVFAGYILINRYVYTTYKVDTFNYIATFSVWAGIFACMGVLFGRYKYNNKVFIKSNFPIVFTGMLAGIGVGLIVLGQRYTTAINASIVATASIIPTVIFSRMMLKEKLDNSQLMWIFVMFIGLYIAIVGIHSLKLNKGDSIILSSALILGFTNTFSKTLMKTNSSDLVSDIRLVSGAVLFAVIAIGLRGASFWITNVGIWPILAGLFYWLTIKFFYASIHHINPSKAIVLLNGDTIITPIFGVLILSEAYGWSKFIGSIIILFSIYYINR